MSLKQPQLCLLKAQLFKLCRDADNRWLRSRHQTLLQHPLLLLVPFILLLLIDACSSGPAKQPRQLSAEEQQGRDLFVANCAVCHNAYKKEPLQGPPLVGMFRKQELPSGMPATDQHVHDTILIGRRNMPPFNGILDDRQVDELIAFLHTL